MTISTGTRIYVAGHSGMVGSAIVRQLRAQGYKNIVTRTHQELDLINQQAVADFFKQEQPTVVFLAAGKVGGIHANNTFPAEFIYENLMIETNIIHQAYVNKVKRLLFLSSSCSYPKHADQPIKESSLLTGELEKTNEAYAIAKIAGLKLCESYQRQYQVDFRSVTPTNLYGPNDNFHPENSHVIPAMLRRFHEATITGAEKVVLWGSGSPIREFLYVDDLASACIHIMNIDKKIMQTDQQTTPPNLNIGSGQTCTIRELAETIATVTGFEGKLEFNPSMPDGMPIKFLDSELMTKSGWQTSISLEAGLKKTYAWFLANQENFRG